LSQAKAARDDEAQALPSVPVWAEEIRVARGGQPVAVAPAEGGTAGAQEANASASGADAKPAKTPKVSITKMDPAQRQALREAANQAVTGALTLLAAEANEANLLALRQTLKDHGRNMDTNMDAKVHEALIAAGDADGWQRHVADQTRLALVLKAEALFKKVPVKTEDTSAQTAEAQEVAEVEASVQAEEKTEEKTAEKAPQEVFHLEPVLGGRKMQEALRQLREEWKQADQGGLPNHALWKRFDAVQQRLQSGSNLVRQNQTRSQ